jgi:hypothetical protein
MMRAFYTALSKPAQRHPEAHIMTTLATSQITNAKRISIPSVCKAAAAVAVIGAASTCVEMPFGQAHVTAVAEERTQPSAVPGEPDSALAVTRKAVLLQRHLLRVSPFQYQPALAVTLQDMSVRLFDAGDAEGARGAMEEVVAVRRLMAHANSRNIAILEESLQLLSRLKAASGSEAANMGSAQTAVH